MSQSPTAANRKERRHLARGARRVATNRYGHTPRSPGQDLGGAAASHVTGLVQKATQLHHAGQLREAQATYRQVLDIDPDHADTNHLLGVLLAQGGHHAQAVESISRAIAVAPDQAMYHGNLGTAFQKLGRLEEALAAYGKALAIDPNFAGGHYNLAIVLRKRGRREEAVASYGRALALNPDYAVAHYNLGILLQEMERPDDAVASYRRALAVKPDYALAHNNLGDALHKLGRLDEAVASHRQALAIAPEYAEAHNNLGSALKDQGQLDEAVVSYRQALAIKPDFAEAHYNSGLVLTVLGRLDEAAVSYHKSLAIKPDFAEAHYNLGTVHQKLGRLDEAVASHHKALAIKPDYAEAHYNLGTMHQNLGRLDEAVASYRKALAIKPDFAGAHSNLGTALKDLGKLDEAMDSYHKALAIKPDFAEAHYNLGTVLQELERSDEAVASHHKALAIKPDFAEAHNNLGSALKDLGKLDEAAASYRKALVTKPDYAEAYYNLGTVLQELGRLDEVVACCHKALAIKPDFSEAWNVLTHSTRALQFPEAPGDRRDGFYQVGLSQAARATSHFALFQYYLDKFRPHEADESFTKAMAALPPRIDQEVTVSGGSHVSAPDTAPDTAPRLPDKLVALLHFGRSGTGFLHGLIDGHPEISTLPSIYLRGFFNAGVWEKLAANGWRGLPERFADEFEVLFDATSPKPVPSRLGDIVRHTGVKEGMTTLGEGRDEALSLDRDKFCAEATRLMKQHQKIDPGVFLKIIHGAFEKTVGSKTEKHTIFYHIHNPDDFARLIFLRYMPDARLVMMVREPIQSCESWSRPGFENNDYSYVSARIIEMLLAIDQIPFRTQGSVGIRLEDLKRRPKETLRALCRWLGIEETPSLYETTAQGKKWWGDPSSPDYDQTKAVSPFDEGPITRAVGTIFSDRDQLILRTLFYPFSVRFGYRDADPIEFKKNLREIRPELDDLLDFEKAISERLEIDPAQLKCRGTYRRLHGGLLDRWNVLDELGDYPGMLKPLDIA